MPAIFDLKNAILTIHDGTPSVPLSITAKLGDGNFTWSEKRAIEYKKDRGLLDTVRLGDQDPLDVKFEFNWVFILGDTGDGSGFTTSIHDALTKQGGATAWISSDANTCAPYAVDLVLTYTPCALKTEVITFVDFRYEQLDFDAKAGTVSCTGKCNVIKPTDARV